MLQVPHLVLSYDNDDDDRGDDQSRATDPVLVPLQVYTSPLNKLHHTHVA